MRACCSRNAGRTSLLAPGRLVGSAADAAARALPPTQPPPPAAAAAAAAGDGSSELWMDVYSTNALTRVAGLGECSTLTHV
jgi:hypothetical protein